MLPWIAWGVFVMWAFLIIEGENPTGLEKRIVVTVALALAVVAASASLIAEAIRNGPKG